MQVYTQINQEITVDISIEEFIQAIKQTDMSESKGIAQQALSDCIKIIKEMPDEFIQRFTPEIRQRIAELLEAEAKRYRIQGNQ